MPLVQVYSCRDAMEAHLLQGMLESKGIAAVVMGETLANAAGALPFESAAFPTLWVDQADHQCARSFVTTLQSERAHGRMPISAPDWTCPNCGERIEGQFTDCWNCQTPRPQVSAEQPHRTDVIDASPLQSNLLCIRCEYNLRGLTARHHCPECGLPVLRTLLDALAANKLPLKIDVQLVVDALFDSASRASGFPAEALAVISHAWLRATEADDRSEPAEDVALWPLEMIRLDVEPFGDPEQARATLRRWGILTTADVAHVIQRLIELQVLHAGTPATDRLLGVLIDRSPPSPLLEPQ
jgi:rubrerythrin